MGLERIICLLEQKMSCVRYPDVYIMTDEKKLYPKALDFADQLRAAINGVKVYVDLQGSSLKKQFKRAEKSGSKYVVTMTNDIIEKDVVEISSLQQQGQCKILSPLEVIQYVKREIVDHSFDKSTA